MRFPGFCGPAYQSQSLNANAQSCRNLYLERDESGTGKSEWMLIYTPGSKTFCSLADSPGRGLFTINGRLFAVSGGTVYEIFSDRSSVKRGSVSFGTSVVSIAASQTQVAIASEGNVFILDIASSAVLSPITAPVGNVSQIVYTDGYFIGLIREQGEFQLSGLLDGLNWSGLDVSKFSVFPDKPVGMIADHREVAFCGPKQSVVYYNSGNPSFPFDVTPSGFLEQGLAAQFSLVRMDNSVFWLGADERGSGIAYRAEGYRPERISNHAIEYAWAQYPRIDDAIAYAYQEQGHSFWVIRFPSANSGLGATWVYDAAVGQWHERSYFDTSTGKQKAHRSAYHAFAFNKHFVMEPTSGTVYEMSSKYYDDDGTPIRRERATPHVAKERKWVYYPRIEFEIEAGVGPLPPLTNSVQPIVLGDGFGGAWLLTANDDGTIHLASTTQAVQKIVLNDSVTANTSWELIVNNQGGNQQFVQLKPFAYSLYPQSIPVVNVSGTYQTALSVNAGVLRTTYPLVSNARGPQLMVSWSNDSGHTFGPERMIDLGQAGEFWRRPHLNRLGRAGKRGSRVFKVACTDPIPLRIIDAYLEVS